MCPADCPLIARSVTGVKEEVKECTEEKTEGAESPAAPSPAKEPEARPEEEPKECENKKEKDDEISTSKTECDKVRDLSSKKVKKSKILLKAHRLILASCSPLIRKILDNNVNVNSDNLTIYFPGEYNSRCPFHYPSLEYLLFNNLNLLIC